MTRKLIRRFPGYEEDTRPCAACSQPCSTWQVVCGRCADRRAEEIAAQLTKRISAGSCVDCEKPAASDSIRCSCCSTDVEVQRRKRVKTSTIKLGKA